MCCKQWPHQRISKESVKGWGAVRALSPWQQKISQPVNMSTNPMLAYPLLSLLLLIGFVYSKSPSQFHNARQRSHLAAAENSFFPVDDFLTHAQNELAKQWLQQYRSCPPLKPTNGTVQDIRKLTFADVSAVFAFGDSISAGFSMKSKKFSKSWYEYRGSAATSGGDEGEITLPNFFKSVKNGVALKGAGAGHEWPWDVLTYKHKVLRPHHPPVDHLNAARSNAHVRELPLQLAYIKSQLADEGVTAEDWKVATILIGANDICWSDCTGSGTYESAKVYGQIVRTTLEQLHKSVPRVFVNLLPLFNISQVYEVGSKDTYCSFVFDLVTECPCMTKHGDVGRDYMGELSVKINEQLQAIAAEWEAKQLKDFRVVYQPFTAGLKIDDEKILSNLDCFHPSLFSNQLMAVSLWNSMQAEASKKPKEIDFDTLKVQCPDENTYLQ